jgi:uncharacterized protein (DUF2141 family)
MKMNMSVKTPAARKQSILALVFFMTGISEALAGDLTVVIDNIKSDQGNVRIALFNNAKDFPKVFSYKELIAAKTGSVSFTFKDLPAGSYAATAFHDLNGNEKLDKNFVGKPVEPYGFSRDARGTFGPPDFEDAAIPFTEPAKTITFSVK